MPMSRIDVKPEESPDRVGLGLSAGGNDTELNPTVFDWRTWFTVHVEFGTPSGSQPRQVYNLVIDSGSPDLWVVSNGCEKCGWTDHGNASGYDLSDQDTTTMVPVELHYGGVSGTPARVRGFMTEDAVSLEGNKISDAFAFAVATSVKGLPLGRNLSGIFPLAPDYPNGGNQNKTGPIRALREAGVIDSDDVGFSANSVNPSLTIGGIDEAFTYESSGMAEVTSSNFGHYVVAIDNVTVNGAVLSPAGETFSYMDALLDTGTTFWYAPSAILEAFYQAIPGGKIEYDSGGNAYGILPEEPQGPTIVSVQIGGKSFGIGYSSLLNLDEPRRPEEAGYVYGTLMKSTNDAWILGLSFLENVYVAFNPTWSQVRIWPLSEANGGPPSQQPAEQDQTGRVTVSTIYGYSTITTEVVTNLGARIWSETVVSSTWVPVTTTTVSLGVAAPTPTTPAPSPSTELEWIPSVVTQTVIFSDQGSEWTETSTVTSWAQSVVTPTAAPEAQQQQEEMPASPSVQVEQGFQKSL